MNYRRRQEREENKKKSRLYIGCLLLLVSYNKLLGAPNFMRVLILWPFILILTLFYECSQISLFSHKKISHVDFSSFSIDIPQGWSVHSKSKFNNVIFLSGHDFARIKIKSIEPIYNYRITAPRDFFIGYIQNNLIDRYEPYPRNTNKIVDFQFDTLFLSDKNNPVYRLSYIHFASRSKGRYWFYLYIPDFKKPQNIIIGEYSEWFSDETIIQNEPYFLEDFEKTLLSIKFKK